MQAGAEFEDFVRARSAALLRTAYALVGDHGHAEDMLQTALLRTARRWAVARDAPEAYARQVLLNLGRDRVRGLRRRPSESALPEGARRPGVVAGPAEEIGERETVVQALMRLPASQRRVVVLRFLEDLPVAETAQLLGISEGTVKSHTARALASLRTTFNDNSAAGGGGTSEVFHA